VLKLLNECRRKAFDDIIQLKNKLDFGNGNFLPQSKSFCLKDIIEFYWIFLNKRKLSFESIESRVDGQTSIRTKQIGHFAHKTENNGQSAAACQLVQFRQTIGQNNRVIEWHQTKRNQQCPFIRTTNTLIDSAKVSSQEAIGQVGCRIQQSQSQIGQRGNLNCNLFALFNHISFFRFFKIKEKLNREHELHQKMKNEKNLNSAKKANVEKLVN